RPRDSLQQMGAANRHGPPVKEWRARRHRVDILAAVTMNRRTTALKLTQDRGGRRHRLTTLHNLRNRCPRRDAKSHHYADIENRGARWKARQEGGGKNRCAQVPTAKIGLTWASI